MAPVRVDALKAIFNPKKESSSSRLILICHIYVQKHSSSFSFESWVLRVIYTPEFAILKAFLLKHDPIELEEEMVHDPISWKLCLGHDKRELSLSHY